MRFLRVLAIVILVAAVGAAIVFFIVIFKRYGLADRIREFFGGSGGAGGKKREEADAVTPQVSRQGYDREKAKEEFVEKSFTGVYEAIYKVSQGQSKRSNDILDDLNSRIHYLKGAPNIQTFWRSLFTGYESFAPEKLKETTAEFMKFVFEAGIERNNSAQVTVDETTRYKYYNSGDGEFVKGDKMKVDRAYWSLGDKILEKGVLIPL